MAGTFSGPFHILSYGTLLGSTFWHSFVGGIVMFRTLERPQFSAVQTNIFPIYFGLQTVAPVVLALTYPGNEGSPFHLSGLLDPANQYGALVPIATVFVTGLLNWVVLLPATQKVMARRRAQEKKDGKKYYDPAPHSDDMQGLNKEFGTLHGISSLLNLGTFVSAIAYGFHLAGRLQ